MIVRDLLICLLQMYLLEDLEKNMLPYRRENFLGKFLVYFVIALVMLGINHLESSIFNMVMIQVTYMIVSMVVFRGNIWKKLVIVCCYYVLAIIPEFLFATLTNAYGVTGASEGFGTEIEKTLALLLMSTMTFLFIKCINQVTRKRDYLTIENKTFTVLLMLPTATIIILGCVFYSNISFEGMNRVMVPVGASLLLLTNIFIFSVFDRFVEKSEEVKKMDRLYQKSRAEIANLQYMNKVNEDNRAFLHDINKFICTVAGLMEEGENQEVKEIMEHLGVRIQSLQKGVYCEHPILNSILCERKFLAESKNISYMFGDWDYIAGILTEWAESPKMSKLRFPIICLYSPYTEDRTGKDRTTTLELAIMVDTLKDYTNEEREKVSFEGALRPIYDAFIKSIDKSPDLVHKYNNSIPHYYEENYRYGRKGVEANGKPFRDFIDVIEIKDLRITIKNIALKSYDFF